MPKVPNSLAGRDSLSLPPVFPGIQVGYLNLQLLREHVHNACIPQHICTYILCKWAERYLPGTGFPFFLEVNGFPPYIAFPDNQQAMCQEMCCRDLATKGH